MQLPLVIPCPAQRWEDSLKCKGGISRVLLTFPLSLCVNLASCVQLWDGQNSSAPCTWPAAPPRQSRKVCWLLQNCWEQWEASSSHCLHGSPCSQRRLRDPVCKRHPDPVPYLLLHTVLCYPTCTAMATPRCSGLDDRSFAENFWGKWSSFSVQVQHWLLSIQVTLNTKCDSVQIFSNRTFLDIFFLSNWGRYANTVVISLTYAYFVLLCLPAEEAPDGEQDNEKLSKSPPPPPPRRSYLPGSGLTTTRSGDVIYTARKEAAALKVWWFIL